MVYWLEHWPCKSESAQQSWFESDALNAESGVSWLWLDILPEKPSVK